MRRDQGVSVLLNNHIWAAILEMSFCGTFSYADDILILAPTLTSVHHMLFICEEFAKEYEVIFNSSKSKILVFPYLEDNMGSTIEQVHERLHLGK